MRFELDDEHYDYAAVVDDALAATDPATVTRALFDGDDAAAEAMIVRLGQIGVPALTVPVEHGGSGLSVSDCVLVIERIGANLVPDPVAAGVAVVAPVVARYAPADVAAELLRGLATGESRTTVQDGWSGGAPWAAAVDVVVVVDGDEVHATRPGIGDVVPVDGIDPGRRLARVLPTAPVLVTLGRDAATEVRRRAAVASALSLVGLAQTMISMAASYARHRVQFGQPIGAFHGVKHQLANAYTEVEGSRRTAWWAALTIDTRGDDAGAATAMAKAMIGEAARQASSAALQVHGGIGYTWECDLHLWMKRCQALEGAWGSTDEQWRRLRSPAMA
jgi:alkylation response protein AidB-like acyl-CoA dehydrogenase